MANSLRISLFVLLSVWAVFSIANLQLKPILGYFHGGMYQFTTENFHGWPRSDALNQRIHSVQSPTSVFGPMKYDTKVTAKWRLDSLAVNAIFSITLLTAILYCVGNILFGPAQFRLSLSTVMIIVAAVAITLTLFLSERELHRLAFENTHSVLQDLNARTLRDLDWNGRLVVIVGVFFTMSLAVRYTGGCLSNLVTWLHRSSARQQGGAG